MTTTTTNAGRSAAELARDEAQKARARENGAAAFAHWIENDGSLRLARMVADGDIPLPESATDHPPIPAGINLAMNVEHGRKPWVAGFLAACRAYVEAKAGGA